MIRTRQMRYRDIEEVVAIHVEQFPNSRSTSLGKPFLRKMYAWFLENQTDLANVAFKESQCVGFVVGAVGGYGRSLFRFAIWQILLGLVLRPRLIFAGETYQLAPSYIKGLFANSRNQRIVAGSASPKKASLASIAVRRSAQGKGAGEHLIRAFEAGAKSLEAEVMGLSVEIENMRARALYEKCGWIAQPATKDKGTIYYLKLVGA